jgi:hypothetical protein
MGELVRLRARAQLGMLAAVMAVMVAGSALVGVCLLLTTVSPQRALQLAIVHAPAADVQVGVALGFPDDPDDPAVDKRVAATARNASGAVAQASALLTGTFRRLPTTLTAWTSTIMQYLPKAGGPLRLAYLADPGSAAAHGTIVAGRWPVAAGEVALPASTARALALDVGRSTTLAAAPGRSGPKWTVVGTFVPRPGAAWLEDPLQAAGVGPNYRGYISAYGPFVVAPGGLATSRVPLRRVTLRVQPHLAHATAAEVSSASAAVDALNGELQGALRDRTQNVVVDLPFASTVDSAHTQRGVTSSGVLSVALLGASLAGITVVLAARLVAARRASEVVMLVARGASRGRLVAQASAEAAVLAVLCIAPATVLALVAFRMLSNSVGLGPADVPMGGLLLLVTAVTAVTLSLGALLVLPWLRSGASRGGREDRVGVVARSGADLLLLALAVFAYLQLRDHGVATGASVDPVLVVGPALFLLAGAALTLRALPMLASRADARATGARSLALPLAAWGVARRPHGAAAAFLVVLATACATFGVGFSATWSQSERDQAAAGVGTDLSVPAPVDALSTGAALRAATGGRVSPATSRTLTLGSLTPRGDETVQLVAVDTRDADSLLRGRLPAGGWAKATQALPPSQPVGGVLLTGTSEDLVVSGTAAHGVSITAAISLVAQDRDGARAALPAGVVALDGAPHALTLAVPRDVQVVAVDAHLTSAAAGDFDQQSQIPLAIDVTFRQATLKTGGTWTAARPTSPVQVTASLDRVTAATVHGGVRLRLDGTAFLPDLSWTDGALTALAFQPVEVVPVVVSERLAQELGLKVGDGVQLTLGLTPVPAKVMGVSAYVPSQPRAAAMLADIDTLSRAALSNGVLETLTDQWWVGGAIPPSASARLEAEGFGTVTDRAAVEQEAVHGPLRAAQRAAVTLLVAAALVLMLVGVALHSATALQARELDVARLRGLGASRRSVRRSLLAEQTVLTGLPILVGCLLGGLACWALAPLLAVSPQGLPPMPAATASWPWPAQAATIFALLLGSVAVIGSLAAHAVRRGTLARLRMDGQT